MNSFLWFDYETFGTDTRRDRPAQFGALRTDLELKPMGAPMVWYCQPARDYLPDPAACLITGITPQVCAERGLPEHEFAARIQAARGESGTISAGYNSIRFDDEVTRFLFWRNLLDPYAHEWRDGCARWDLLDVLRLAHALRPQGLEWPTRRIDEGPLAGQRVASFKLTDLTAANGIPHADAHDALSDVHATLALARKMRAGERQRKLFDFALTLRDKHKVLAQMGLPAAVGQGAPFIHVSTRLGAERGNLALMWPLAQHPVNRNEVIVWDLSHDPRELADLDAQAVRRRLFTPADELQVGDQRLPIKTIHVNRAPMVVRYAPAFASDLERWGIDLVRCEQNADAARLLPDLSSLWAQVFAKQTPAPDTDPELDLYGAFVGDEDRRRLASLHTRASVDRDHLAARAGGFDDERLGELVFRWRARNFPQSLSPDEHRRWDALRRARLFDGAGGARTLDTYMARIDELSETADDAAQDLLGSLYDWAEAIAPERESRGAPQRDAPITAFNARESANP